MRGPITLCIAVTISIICSCQGYGTRSLLKDVESFIQERPDSALVVLEGLDTSPFKQAAVKAQYSLLYSMALDNF